MAGASLFASCNSLCGIGVYMRAIGYGIGASLWLGGSPHPQRWAKRKGHLRFLFLFELLPFPCLLVWRRPETGDRFEKENGSRVTLACLSPPIRSSQIIYCYTYRLLSAGATQGELPEGQEKPHWGAPPCNPSAHCFTAGSIPHFLFSITASHTKKAPLSRCFSHFFRRTYP